MGVERDIDGMLGLFRGDMGTDGQVDLYRMGRWKSRGEDSHGPRYLCARLTKWVKTTIGVR